MDFNPNDMILLEEYSDGDIIRKVEENKDYYLNFRYETSGKTLLDLAINFSRYELAKSIILLDDSQLLKEDMYGDTPLFYLMRSLRKKEDEDRIKKLFLFIDDNYEINYDKVNVHGYNLLHEVSRHRSLYLFNRIMAKYSNLNIKTKTKLSIEDLIKDERIMKSYNSEKRKRKFMNLCQ